MQQIAEKVYYCAYCGAKIERKIFPCHLKEQRDLYCSGKCAQKGIAKRFGGRVGRNWKIEHLSYSTRPPGNCDAGVKSCLECPYPDCKY